MELPIQWETANMQTNHNDSYYFHRVMEEINSKLGGG
jgi:hypothetical protein